MLQDIRFALRMLARARGVAATAVVLLALGIGANTAIFSLIRGILMRPVPGVREPERLVRFQRIERWQKGLSFGYPDYIDYRDEAQLFTGIAAECQTSLSFASETTERIRGAVVSGNYFSVLGVKPALGRLLTPEDDRVVGAHWVAVLSYGFWRRAFASDLSIAGKNIRLNGHDFRVVGVAAEDFRGMSLGVSTEIWLPLMMQPQAIPRLTPGILSDRMAGWLAIFGRLKPGVRIELANAEAGIIARRLAQAYPQTNETRSAEVFGEVGLYPDARADLRRFFGLLFAAVGVLLLISCCNVANLFLARATARRREMAVRLALGAGRIRLMRQLLTESLLLCALAAAAGLLVVPWSLSLMMRVLPPQESALKLPWHLDFTILGFTLLISIATGVFFGLAPALVASKADVAASLKAVRPATGFHRSWFARFSVVAQVSLSLVLLIAAGLVVRTIERTLADARGFDSDHVLVASMDLSILNYPEAKARLFFTQLEQRLAAIPGVRSASLAKTYPASEWIDRGLIFYEGQDPLSEEMRMKSDRGILAERNMVSPGYFRTLGIALVAGRDFGPQDAPGAPPVTIVSQRLAARLWPGENPLGKRIAVPAYRGPRRPPVAVIGVAADAKYRSLVADAPLLLYLPLLQNREVFVSIQVRTASDPAALLPAVEREVASLDRNLPVYNARTLAEQVALALWEQRTAAVLIGLFGVLALVVASIGLYSVVAQAVAHRTREIGIRMAIGAKSGDVLGMLVRNGMTLAVIGVLAGTAAASVLTRLEASLLYAVSATDPATFVSIALVLLLVSPAASYLPARAATRIDPVAALRHE